MITSQVLEKPVQAVGALFNADLTFEGTKQIARDVQVFKRLDTEAFVRAGVFRDPATAQTYLENATEGQLKGLIAKINGSGQETDWLRVQQGSLKSLFEKSQLFNKNAPGVDGEIINRYTGKRITRVTIKTAQGRGGLNTNVQDVVEAVVKGRLGPEEQVFGAVGTKDALVKKFEKRIAYEQSQGHTELAERLIKTKDEIKVIENNTPQAVAKNRDRILEKIKGGEAYTHITTEQVFEKAANGAVIGAAVGLTVSSITTYIRYQNGELSKEEAFRDISEDTAKSALIGGGMGAITLFLPGGPVGFIAGVGIGLYLDASLTNVLDEIWGKGAYLAILNASGYICGTTTNLVDALQEVQGSMRRTQGSIQQAKHIHITTEENLSLFSKEMEELL